MTGIEQQEHRPIQRHDRNHGSLAVAPADGAAQHGYCTSPPSHLRPPTSARCAPHDFRRIPNLAWLP